MDREKYISCELDIIRFTTEDIVTASQLSFFSEEDQTPVMKP